MGNVIGMLVQVRREAPGESARSEHVTYKAEHEASNCEVFEMKSVFRRFNFKL